MATYYGSPETCKVPYDLGYAATPEEGGVTRRGEHACLTQIGNRHPNVRPEHIRNTRTEQQRWWRTHPAEAQALADDASVSLESLLCSGCRKLLARLQRSGDWP